MIGTLGYYNSKYYSDHRSYSDYFELDRKFFGDILKTDEYSLSIVLYELLIKPYSPYLSCTKHFKYYKQLLKCITETKNYHNEIGYTYQSELKKKKYKDY